MSFKKRMSGSWTDTPNYIHNTATDTITTLPADIYPTGTTATVGLKGQMEQNGTPTPTTPIQPSECGDLETSGEKAGHYKIPISSGGGNLFDSSNYTLIQVATTAYRYGTSLGVLSQGTYTFNATKSAGAQSIYLTAKLNDVYTQTTISSVPFSFTADGDSEYIIRTANNTGTTWEAEKYSNMMLNLGSEALPYSPYNRTTTPIYLGEVETTRRIKKLVLTGNEIFYRDKEREGSWRFFTDKLVSTKDYTGICSHFENISNNDVNNSDNIGFSFFNRAQFVCRCPKSIANTVADFKSYLAQQYAAGTPVMVWYILETPTTGIVNEPLRKIDDYADEVSGITIPTITGANTIDINTTLKPSEVSINYKGWHPVIDVHRFNGTSWD